MQVSLGGELHISVTQQQRTFLKLMQQSVSYHIVFFFFGFFLKILILNKHTSFWLNLVHLYFFMSRTLGVLFKDMRWKHSCAVFHCAQRTTSKEFTHSIQPSQLITNCTMSIMQRQLINNTVDILLTENQTSIGFFTVHQMSLQCVRFWIWNHVKCHEGVSLCLCESNKKIILYNIS